MKNYLITLSLPDVAAILVILICVRLFLLWLWKRNVRDYSGFYQLYEYLDLYWKVKFQNIDDKKKKLVKAVLKNPTSRAFKSSYKNKMLALVDSNFKYSK